MPEIISNQDTIAAISTPHGSGGIAVVRISGDKALGIIQRVFRGEIDVLKAEPRRAYWGYIVDKSAGKPSEKVVSWGNEELLDEVVITIYRAPHSYTREDLVEISCHGGVYVTKRILELLLKKGARLAEPGEFTKRAFLNGRIDLSQAEAVADLIRAKTELGRRASLAQLEGELSRKINSLRDDLVEICSLLELELDFSEEDVEFVERGQILSKMDEVRAELAKLLTSFQQGKIFREGVKLVIAGKPNVGKSSLLNALLREDRAIVTDIPGTTRDALEEQLDIKGMLFRVIDTAGLRSTQDRVELEGVRRTERHLREADLILLMVDVTERLSLQDEEIIRRTISTEEGTQVILVVNKIDLERQLEMDQLRKIVGDSPVVEISAKEGWGLEHLEAVLVDSVLGADQVPSQEVWVTKLRHKEALVRAQEGLELVRDSLLQGMSPEFVVVGLRSALDNLGEITGAVTTEDILDNIFSNFCIGK